MCVVSAGMRAGGSPPRNAVIKGQPHLLAYITPDEASTLKQMGGAGKPGPMGIMSFYDEGDDYTGIGGDQASLASGETGLAPSSFVGSIDDDGNVTVDEVGEYYRDAVQETFGRPDEMGRYRDSAQTNINRFLDNRNKSIGSKISTGIKSVASASPLRTALNTIFGRNKGISPTQQTTTQNLRTALDIAGYGKENPDSVSLTDDGLGVEIDTGTGTINVGPSGITTYSGVPNPEYDGPFENLVNPQDEVGQGETDRITMRQAFDPCPEGYKFNAETGSCEKIDEDTNIGTKFVRSTAPFPDLSRYGLDGGEFEFFDQMPGIIGAKDGIPRGPTGEIKGAGGPKDDLVGPFMLSNQEYVEPYERVLDEGDGNYDRGIRVLEKKRMSALRKYRDRVKSEERNRS